MPARRRHFRFRQAGLELPSVRLGLTPAATRHSIQHCGFLSGSLLKLEKHILRALIDQEDFE